MKVTKLMRSLHWWRLDQWVHIPGRSVLELDARVIVAPGRSATTTRQYLYLRTYSRIPYSATVNHLTFLSKLRKVNKWNKRGIAARKGDATRPYRYGNSHATWDHTVLPAARQRWHSRPYPSEARTRFSDLGVMQDWVDLGTTVSEQPMPKAAYHSVRRDKLPSTVRCEPGSSHTAVGRANY